MAFVVTEQADAAHADPAHASGHGDLAHGDAGHGHSGYRQERPEDWGWHAEMGRGARIAGIVCLLLLVSMVLSSHGSKWELVWLIGFAAFIGISLIWDYYRRRNAWRS